MVGKYGSGYADHTPAQVWKDAEHEYDGVFLILDWERRIRK